MGGTIANHTKDGDKVFAVSMTDGVGSRDALDTNDINQRVIAADKAARILGFEWLEAGKFLDNEMDKYSLIEVVKFIENIKNLSKPDIVYTHSSSDLNIDHRIVSEAVLTAFRPQPKEICREIRAFEVSSATDYGHKSVTGSFYPNLFIDITNTWEEKLLALKEYASEMREYPHTRSYRGIESLSKIRGNQVGLHQAEAFEIIRKIQ